MRVYIVDATNACRRGDYDPRFPEVEEGRAMDLVARLSALAAPLAGRIELQLVFDGPRRDVGQASPPVCPRFSGELSADELILGAVRTLSLQGRRAVVATADGELARQVSEEGGRAVSFSDLERRLRSGRA